MKKRILPALLALCMVMSLLPVSVFAEDAGTLPCSTDTSTGDEVKGKDPHTTECYAGEKCKCLKKTETEVKEEGGEEEGGEEENNTVSTQADAAKKVTFEWQPLCSECVKAGCNTAKPTTCLNCDCDLSAEGCSVKYDSENSKWVKDACACKAAEGETEGVSCGKTCKFQKCDDVNCGSYGTIHEKGVHTPDAGECTKGSATNSLRTSCSKKSGHMTDCAFACKEVPGCTETNNHTDKHVGDDLPCTGDKQCGAKTHQPNCPSFKLDEVQADDNVKVPDPVMDEIYNIPLTDSGKVVVVVEKKINTYVNCSCGKDHKEDGTHKDAAAKDLTKCPNGVADPTKKVGVPVTVNVSATKTIAFPFDLVYVKDANNNIKFEAKTQGNTTTQEPVIDEAATIANMKAAEAKAKASAKAEDKDFSAEAIKAAADNYVKLNPVQICDVCAKQLPADTCTMTWDCKASSHKDDCLSLCNHSEGNTCPNTEGVASAHAVWYEVKEMNAAGKTTQSYVYKTRTEAIARYDDLKAANAAAIKTAEGAVRTAQANVDKVDGVEGKETELKEAEAVLKTAKDELKVLQGNSYVVVAVHCPQAKIQDSVVVSAEGESVADPADSSTNESKTPTKAEEFTDMEDWMAEGVQYMLDKGWMEGLGDGTFDGRGELKTDMVLTVLARMNGKSITGSTWADDAKAWAEKNAELFEDIDLTAETMGRKDVVLVLWRQAGKPEPSADFELEFTDADGLEGDRLTAMKWAVENEIVQGNGDGTVSPDGSITRAAMSLLAMRADKAANK